MKNKYPNIDYKTEYKKYKKIITNMQKEQAYYIQKINQLENKETFEGFNQEETLLICPPNEETQNSSSFPKTDLQKKGSRVMIDELFVAEEKKNQEQ